MKSKYCLLRIAYFEGVRICDFLKSIISVFFYLDSSTTVFEVGGQLIIIGVFYVRFIYLTERLIQISLLNNKNDNTTKIIATTPTHT